MSDVTVATGKLPSYASADNGPDSTIQVVDVVATHHSSSSVDADNARIQKLPGPHDGINELAVTLSSLLFECVEESSSLPAGANAAVLPELDEVKVALLPMEIKIRVLELALVTAEVMIHPLLTGKAPKPNVPMHILLVNRAVHIAAHKSFIESNTFDLAPVGAAGSPLKTTNEGFGKCCCRGCGVTAPGFFNSGHFTLGDVNPAQAKKAMENLNELIYRMPAPLRFGTLAVEIQHSFWRDYHQVMEFLGALRLVVVHEHLILTGLDVYLSMSTREIASELGMNVQPTRFIVQPRDATGEFARFTAIYQPAMTLEEEHWDIGNIGAFHDPLSVYVSLQSMYNDGRYRIVGSS